MTSEEKVRRFEKALKQGGGTHSIADVMQRLRERKAECFPSPSRDSLIVTEVLQFPQLRACNYWVVAGLLDEVAAMQPEIDAWARAEGCTVATATGRMGWLRLSQTPLGEDWKPVGVKFAKDLRHE